MMEHGFFHTSIDLKLPQFAQPVSDKKWPGTKMRTHAKVRIFLNTVRIFLNTVRIYLNTVRIYLNKSAFFLNTVRIFLNKFSWFKKMRTLIV